MVSTVDLTRDNGSYQESNYLLCFRETRCNCLFLHTYFDNNPSEKFKKSYPQAPHSLSLPAPVSRRRFDRRDPPRHERNSAF